MDNFEIETGFAGYVRKLEEALERARQKSEKKPVKSPLTGRLHQQYVVERDLAKAKRWIEWICSTSSSHGS